MSTPPATDEDFGITFLYLLNLIEIISTPIPFGAFKRLAAEKSQKAQQVIG
jgi:hypothetical protein